MECWREVMAGRSDFWLVSSSLCGAARRPSSGSCGLVLLDGVLDSLSRGEAALFSLLWTCVCCLYNIYLAMR